MDFKRIIDKAVTVKKGSYSLYIQCNKKVGIKCYEDESTRDDAFSVQEKAYNKGLAPKCFALINLQETLKNGKIKTWYCYTTQVVKVFKKEKINKIWWNAKFRETRSKIQSILDSLESDLFEQGFEDESRDMHRFNIGFIGSKPVAIDFGCYEGDVLATSYGERMI
jgi:hypothetical protein